MSSLTNIAVCQVHLEFGDRAENLRRTTSAIEEAVGMGAQVIVLPELANTGYHFRDRAEAAALGESVTGDTVTAWATMAAELGAVVVGGVCETDRRGLVRNSSVIIDRTGVRDVYRKSHLWDQETLIFEPGSELPRVVETEHGRIATVICYDIEFPEWVRIVSLAGADLIAVPTNWPLMDTPDGERPFMVAIVQSMAETNGIYIAVSDRARQGERGRQFAAASVIVGPDGYPMAPLIEDGDPGTTMTACDLTATRSKSVGAYNDLFADRRTDLYGGRI